MASLDQKDKSMENQFYDNLPKYFKDFFDKHDYKPANVFDANNFFKSCMRLDNLTDIFVKPNKPIIYKGKIMKFVKITSDQPFMACVPQIWQNMSLQQRLKTVIMVFNYYFKEMINDREKKPEIHFISEFNFASSVLGLSYFPKKYIYIPLEKISSSTSSQKIFATIVHEFVHYKQQNEKQQILEWLSQNNYDFSGLSSYQRHLFFERTGSILASISNYYNNRSEALFDAMLSSSDLTRENINLWLELEKTKNKQWRLLKELTYSLSDIESTAQKEETKVFNDLLTNYGGKKETAPKEKTLGESELLAIRNADFDIDDESAKHLENIGYFTNMVEMSDEAYFDVLNYLLEVYKAKKINRPFVENYEETEALYFADRQDKILRQIEKNKMHIEGDKENEF